MGSKSSKLETEQQRGANALRELEESKRKAEEDSVKKLLLQAYSDGRDDAMHEGMKMLESQRQDDAVYALGACLLSAMLSASFAYSARESAAAKVLLKAQEEAKSVAVQQQQEMALERQRVQELAAVNDTQKMLLDNQQRLIEKSREQNAAMRARLHSFRLEHLKLKRKYHPLKVEVKTLRAQNGVLNQRFIVSTAGAIIMACVAGGFAIASHGSGGHAHDSVVPVHASPIADGVTAMAPVVDRKEAAADHH